MKGWLDKYQEGGVAKTDATRTSPALNYRSVEDSARIEREKELARRKTSVGPQSKPSVAMKQAAEERYAQQKRNEKYKKAAEYAQVIGGGLEVAAPFTGPLAPIIGGAGTITSAGSSAYLSGRDVADENYGSALMNAGFGGLGIAGYTPAARAANIGGVNVAKAANAADYVSDVASTYNAYDDYGSNYAKRIQNIRQHVTDDELQDIVRPRRGLTPYNNELRSHPDDGFFDPQEYIPDSDDPFGLYASSTDHDRHIDEIINRALARDPIENVSNVRSRVMDMPIPSNINTLRDWLNYNELSTTGGANFLQQWQEQNGSLIKQTLLGKIKDKAGKAINTVDEKLGKLVSPPRSLPEGVTLEKLSDEINKELTKGVGVKKVDFPLRINLAGKGNLDELYANTQIINPATNQLVNAGNITLARQQQPYGSKKFSEVLFPNKKPSTNPGRDTWNNTLGFAKTADFPFTKLSEQDKAILEKQGVSGEFNKAINEVLKRNNLGNILSGGTGHTPKGAERWENLIQKGLAEDLGGRFYKLKKNGGWLDKYEDGGEINYNDASASAGPGFQGDGYSNVGRNYSPAWGGQFQMGGPVKRFMQPTETFKNYGYNPIEKGMSTEYSTSIGAPGEVYLVPGYRQGKVLQDPEGVFNTYGEHLGGPFKTVKSAEDFAKLRHKYVEQNKNIPAPFKTRDYAMGGSIGGATQGIPGATGFMYARTGTIPSNGKYAKKTLPSAQNGTELDKDVKTIYSGMLPEITVVGSKDPRTEEYYRNIFDTLTKEEGYNNGISSDDPVYNNPQDVDMVFNYPNATDNILGRYEGLMDLGKKYGFPKVHPIDKDSLLSKMAMNIGGDNKPPANYNSSSKTIQADNTEDWVSEMAHHVQMKDNRLNKTIQWMKNDLPALAISEIMLGNRSGQYHVPGTVEHEAHSIIEPKLLEEMKKSESKYKDNPYRKKKIDEFYGDDFFKGLGAYQNGGEMKYYQEGLDWKPKSISKDGSKVIKDDRGQWAHPGEITEIGSNQITMQGVPYPVMGVSDTGDTQMMYPNQEYQYNGNSVTEYPMMQDGGVMDSVINFGKGVSNYFDKLIRTGINKLSELDDSIMVHPSDKAWIPTTPRPKPDVYDNLLDLGYSNPKKRNLEKKLNQDDIYSKDENRIKLGTGRFSGANVSSKLIDDIAAAAKRNNVSVGQLLTLAGRESTFGEDKIQIRKGFTPREYVSGWNIDEKYKPYDPHRFLADKKVPGINVLKDSEGYIYEVADEKAAREYLKKNPQLIEQYKKKLDSTPSLGNRNTFDLSAEFLKEKGIKGYNPGDPNYEKMFNKDYDTLKQDKALMSYLKKKGYKYEQGGQLTKLDQLTNFTNYNTKQPGGWLDRYDY